jgi:hypothetical protein
MIEFAGAVRHWCVIDPLEGLAQRLREASEQ